jgi:hypothetical protein
MLVSVESLKQPAGCNSSVIVLAAASLLLRQGVSAGNAA